MDPVKDRWLAANLSLSFAGLGQFYAGRRIAGVILLLADIALFGVMLLWMLLPSISTSMLLANFGLQVLLWSISTVHAFRSVASLPVGAKSPWRALFWTRFVPGAGHFYAGRPLRGMMFAALVLGSLFVPQSEATGLFPIVAYSAARGLILADSFFVLRRENLSERRWTAAALFVVLLWSQSWVISYGLKCGVAEVFRIPSSAMEPTLLGNVTFNHPREDCPFASYHQAPEGDRILVSKLAYSVSPIRRFDIAVFRFPLNQSKYFVKRVVGLPGEELQIHDGDIYARARGESNFRIVRKSVETQQRVWIRLHEGEDDAADLSTLLRYWTKSPGEITAGGDGGLMLPGSEKEFRMDLTEPPSDSRGRAVGDLRLSCEVRFTGGRDRVQLRLKNRYGSFELSASSGEENYLRWKRGAKELQQVPIRATPSGGWCALELLVYDGQAIVLRDGSIAAQMAFLDVLGGNPPTEDAVASVSILASGGAIQVRRLQAGRDIHYQGRGNHEHGWGDDRPLAVPEDSYILFGDNVANSHDSRAWVKRTFVLKDGRKIVAESQQVNEGMSRFGRHLQERLGLPDPPRFAIDGDEHGNEVAISQEQFDHEEASEPFRFVHRKFFAGRVLKIWWPLSRDHPVR